MDISPDTFAALHATVAHLRSEIADLKVHVIERITRQEMGHMESSARIGKLEGAVHELNEWHQQLIGAAKASGLMGRMTGPIFYLLCGAVVSHMTAWLFAWFSRGPKP